MFKRTVVLTAAIVTLLIPLAAPAAAQPGPPDHYGPPGPPPRLPLFEANLSAEQQAQARKAMETGRAVADPVARQLREAEKQLRSLVLADTPDVAAIDAAREEVNELQQQLFRLQLDVDMELAALLTATQRETLRALPDPPQPGLRRPARAREFEK